MTDTNENTVGQNLVTLENGEIVNFGKSSKMFASYDLEKSSVTFKLVTPQVVDFIVQGMENLPELFKKIVLFGIAEKVKTFTNLPSEALFNRVTKELADLTAGNFNAKSRRISSTVELNAFLKAFAMVNGSGTVSCAGVTPMAVPVSFLLVTDKPHWANVDDITTIDEVTSFWKELSAKEKTAQRRNTFVTTQETYINLGLVDEKEED